MAKKADDTPKVKYLVTDSKGEFVIEIPATWKVTFGAVNPGAGGGMGNRDLHCLRVYDGVKLRGVYCNVRGIRDLAIPMARKVDKQTGSATWTMDSSGNFEGTRKVEVDSGFELDAGDVEEVFS